MAYGFVQSIVRLSQVLTLLAIALFLALGLDPVDPLRWNGGPGCGAAGPC